MYIFHSNAIILLTLFNSASDDALELKRCFIKGILIGTKPQSQGSKSTFVEIEEEHNL